jgi:hypothetical protein
MPSRLGFSISTLLACALVPSAFAGFSFIRKPVVDMPVSLAKGVVKTNEFGSKGDEHFLILIRAQRRLSIDEMTCMMGVNFGGMNPMTCEPKPMLKADWWVKEGDKLIAFEEVGYDGVGASSGRTLERYLGTFDGKGGHRYVLHVRFTADGSRLNVTSPHLVVKITRPSD